ncbi:hypothetical protein WJX79_002157 [Trebouxia sp. C0005]
MALNRAALQVVGWLLLHNLSSASARQPFATVQQVACERPEYLQHAQMARYVVHMNSWGSVASSSIHLRGHPFAAVESYSDGAIGDSTGRLLFFLTSLDATGADVEVNGNVTISLAEVQIPGSCQGTDPEDPTCAKVSISGQMLPVPQDKLKEAQNILFSRHPVMKTWPVGHHFVLYELQIATIRLLDFYGGAADLTPQEYFAAHVSCKVAASQKSES